MPNHLGGLRGEESCLEWEEGARGGSGLRKGDREGSGLRVEDRWTVTAEDLVQEQSHPFPHRHAADPEPDTASQSSICFSKVQRKKPLPKTRHLVALRASSTQRPRLRPHGFLCVSELQQVSSCMRPPLPFPESTDSEMLTTVNSLSAPLR